MYLLDIEALDLGPDVRAVGLDLVEADENREPVRGEDAARIWSRVIRATVGNEPWALDFFSHLDRVRDFCVGRGIKYREANKRSIVIPAPEPAALDGSTCMPQITSFSTWSLPFFAQAHFTCIT